jgi:DNA-3-methyladenine glycosylase I
MPTRCEWASDPVMHDYHDAVWGVPVHDDRLLFEFLILEGAQAGLSWSTILRKRTSYREAFDGFDPAVVARYDDARMAELMTNAGIVRNRLKVRAAVTNAKAVLAIQEERGSFDGYLWSYVDGAPLVNAPVSLADLPVSTPLADALSRDLKKRGMTFVGPTICYSFMQAVGMVNDHTTDCFRYAELTGAAG